MSTQHIDKLAWQQKAACKGPQAAVFFPPSHVERKDEREARERRAKAICAECPVRPACLDYAVQIRELHGIWGGLNELERKQLITVGPERPLRAGSAGPETKGPRRV